MLKELNRILKIRLENDLSDYSEDEEGNIIKRIRVRKRIIQKSYTLIDREMKQDPVMGSVDLLQT